MKFKVIAFLPLLFLSLLLCAHPKYFNSSVGNGYFYQSRADSLHGFDVLHYDISITIDDQEEYIDGVVEATIRAGESLSEIAFELVGLEVSQVLVNEEAATYVHESGVVNTNLTGVDANEEFTLRIDYSGNPILCTNPYALGMFFQTSGIYTISDPNASRYWWPCYDHPWDKAEVDLHIRVRDDWMVACNGIRTNIEDHGDGTKTHHWDGENPMATYLVSIVARALVELNDSFDGIPIQNFVPPSMLENATEDLSGLPQMMQIYSEKYGEYPFEKYGNAVTSFSTYGAMEHQTMTTLASYLITGNHTYDTVIAHELSHQWFGDCLTPLTWKDVWLSEGFAVYSEAIFIEETEGYEAFLNYVQSEIQAYYLNWSGGANYTIYDPDYQSIFTPVTYEKAASILHMIRNWVGDETFFEILQTYYQTFQYGNVVTADFQQVCEDISGLDMDQFFQQWIFEPGLPVLSYCYFTNLDDNSELVTYAKTSSSAGTDFYTHIPVQIEYNDNAEVLYITAEPNDPCETIVELAENFVNHVQFDPENWIMNRGYEEKEMHIEQVYASDSSVLITWSPLWAEIEIDGYNLFRADSENGEYEVVNPNELITETFYIDNSVENENDYYYKVGAVKIIEDKEFLSKLSEPIQAVPSDFPFDQGLLVIDETADGAGIQGNPDDEMVDDFYSAVINTDFTQLDFSEVDEISINDLKHYSTIIWHDDDLSQHHINEFSDVLGAYLIAGGNLIVSGWKTVNDIPVSFYNTFTSIEDWDVVTSWEFIGAFSNLYPDIAVDPDKVNPSFQGALPYVYTCDAEENQIYSYHGTTGSEHEGKAVAIKQDNLVLFSFPLYFCDESDTALLITQLLDEFGETDLQTELIPPAQFSCIAYPNPFNPTLNISYTLPEKSSVSISIYNIKGQKITNCSWKEQMEGKHHFSWDGKDRKGKILGSGIYLYRFQANSYSKTDKVILLQ